MRANVAMISSPFSQFGALAVSSSAGASAAGGAGRPLTAMVISRVKNWVVSRVLAADLAANSV